MSNLTETHDIPLVHVFLNINGVCITKYLVCMTEQWDSSLNKVNKFIKL